MARVSTNAAAALVALAGLPSSGAAAQKPAAPGVVVNDVHSRLNETRVQRVEIPGSVEGIQAIVRQTRVEKRAISIAGGRHVMGGQPFGTDTILVDMARMDKVLGLEAETGILTVQAGIRWPELLADLARVFRLGAIDAASVADAGYRGVMKGRGVVVSGLANKLLALSVRVRPRRVVAAIVRWLNEEGVGPRG